MRLKERNTPILPSDHILLKLESVFSFGRYSKMFVAITELKQNPPKVKRNASLLFLTFFFPLFQFGSICVSCIRESVVSVFLNFTLDYNVFRTSCGPDNLYAKDGK